MNSAANFDLQRFVDAQRLDFETVVNELLAGAKRSHWMWFVFPQLAGLGRSPDATRFAIRSLEEARAYLDHPILGPRLEQCVEIVNRLVGKSALRIFGSPDHLKFYACLTLFQQAGPAQPVFSEALNKYFDGPDPRTLHLLRQHSLTGSYQRRSTHAPDDVTGS